MTPATTAGLSYQIYASTLFEVVDVFRGRPRTYDNLEEPFGAPGYELEGVAARDSPPMG